MSIRLMNEVWDMKLSDSLKLVLLSLADNANDEGLCWPSIATIAKRCSKAERTVQRSISTLEGMGLLRREEVTGRGVRYYLNPRQDDTPDTVAPPPVTVSPHPRHGDTQTIIEPSKNRHNGTREAFTAEKPDGVQQETWDAFVDIRKRKKAPLSPTALRLINKALRESAGTPEETVAKSVMSEWTGVFPIKEGRYNGRSGKPSGWLERN